MLHHDAITGTNSKIVEQDYEHRISETEKILESINWSVLN